MTRRVLIVASSYAPTMIADMHRTRLLAWTLPQAGWEVEVLCPDTSFQQASYLDGDSGALFAPGTAVHSVSPHVSWLFRMLGFGSIGWRALMPMFFAGRRLLSTRRFDLVYLSTTQFPLFLLGPAWKARTGVPFVLDFHDPCFREETTPPVWARSSLKHSLSRWLAKHIESASVLKATGLVSVSPDYLATLERRYSGRAPGWLAEGRRAVIPFSVLERDFEQVRKYVPEVPSWAAEHPTRIVYVGAGGPVMARAFQILCAALSRLREKDRSLLHTVRIELFGTMLGWRDGDPTLLEEISRACGVGDMVAEDPRRVTYRRSVELLLGADGALVLGVDDPAYMPSKLFGYARSGKPLLAVLREGGAACQLIRETPGLGHVIGFDASGGVDPVAAARALRAFVEEATGRVRFERSPLLVDNLAPAMATRHAVLFDACLPER